MASYMYHDLEEPGAIHVPHDLEYANQATRKGASGLPDRQVGKLALQQDDGSYWRLKTTGPEWVPVSPPEPVIGDIGKAIGIVTDGDGYLKLAPIAAGGSLQTGYDFGGPGAGRAIIASDGSLQVTVPDDADNVALSLINDDVTNNPAGLEMSGASYRSGIISQKNVDAIGSNAGLGLTAEGDVGFGGDVRAFVGSFHAGVVPGTVAWTDIGSTAFDVNARTEVYASAGSPGGAILNLYAQGSGSLQEINIGCYDPSPLPIGNNHANINIGTFGYEHEIVIGALSADTVTKLDVLSESDINIRSGSGELNLWDKYLTSAIQLSETGVLGLDGFASTSIVGGMNELMDDLDVIATYSLDDIYHNEPTGDRAVAVDDGSVVWNLGATYGHHIDNGGDYLRVDYGGVDKLDITSALNNVNFNASGNMGLTSLQTMQINVSPNDASNWFLNLAATNAGSGDASIKLSAKTEAFFDNTKTRMQIDSGHDVHALHVVNNDTTSHPEVDSPVVEIENNATIDDGRGSLELSGSLRYIYGKTIATGNPDPTVGFAALNLLPGQTAKLQFAAADYAMGAGGAKGEMQFDASNLIEIGCSNDAPIDTGDIDIACGGTARAIRIASEVDTSPAGSPHTLNIGSDSVNSLSALNAYVNGSIVLKPKGASALFVELSALAGASDGMKIQTGALGDYWHFLRASATQINVAADINHLNIQGSGNFYMNPTGSMDLNPAGNLILDSSGGSIDIGNDLDTGAVNVATNGVRTLALGKLGSTSTSLRGLSLALDSTGSLSMNSSAGAIYIGSSGSFGAIDIGTALAAKAIKIGNATGATGINLDTGTGGLDVDLLGNALFKPSGAVSVEMDLSSVTGTLNGFKVTNTGAAYWNLIRYGSSTMVLDTLGFELVDLDATVLNIGNDALSQTLRFGTGAAAKSVIIGSLTGASDLALRSGTGDIDIGTSIAKTIRVGNTTGATALNLSAGTGGINIGGAASALIGFFGAGAVNQRQKANYNSWTSWTDIIDALVDLGLFDAA